MNSRLPVMTRAERQERARRILDLLRAGNPPSIVARGVGLTTDHVRQIGINGGLGERTEDRQSSVWEMDDEAKREAFARRAAEGARNTLRELSPTFTATPKSEGCGAGKQRGLQ